MSATWVVLAAAGAGAVAVRRRLGLGRPAVAQVADIAKCGHLFALAAEWLREGDTPSAAAVLNLVGPEGWQFAFEEVVMPSPRPRIAAMVGRMSAPALLTTPPNVAASTDRMAQIETLNAIAIEIRTRVRW